MIQGINHTAISTGNMERAIQFYCDLLGFEQVMTNEWDGDLEVADKIMGLKSTSAKLAVLKLGNSCIEQFEFKAPEPKPDDPKRPVCDHGFTHNCHDVTDIDTEYERLKAAGMVFHCPPQDLYEGTVKATYGRDPDGNVVELVEMIGK